MQVPTRVGVSDKTREEIPVRARELALSSMRVTPLVVGRELVRVLLLVRARGGELNQMRDGVPYFGARCSA